MSSSLFLLALITLVLLFIFPSSIAVVVDTDGDWVENGGNYYIVPVNSEDGLTFSQKNGSECPLYITSTQNGNSPGTPVKISYPLLIPDIYEGRRVSFTFQGFMMPCGDSLSWTLDSSSQKAYITADVDADQFGFSRMTFVIRGEYKSNELHTYVLKYATQEGKTYNVGLFKEDGLLGLTEKPTAVSFKKAFNHLQLSANS